MCVVTRFSREDLSGAMDDKDKGKRESGNPFVCLFVCLFRFYCILTFVGYLMPNPFLCK